MNMRKKLERKCNKARIIEYRIRVCIPVLISCEALMGGNTKLSGWILSGKLPKVN